MNVQQYKQSNSALTTVPIYKQFFLMHLHLPANWSRVQYLACKDTARKTCHFAPSSSSSDMALLSFPASICPGENQWEGPTILSPVTTHIQFETTLLSHTSRHFAGARRRKERLAAILSQAIFYYTNSTANLSWLKANKQMNKSHFPAWTFFKKKQNLKDLQLKI